MRFLFKAILIAVLAFFGADFLPWYGVVLAAFLGSVFIQSNNLVAFLSGFVGIGLLWFTMAWLIDYETGSILTDKVAGIFSLPSGLLLVVLTGFIGAIVGGFGALTGNSFRRIFESTKRKSGRGYYS
jgi:hypothetical protein